MGLLFIYGLIGFFFGFNYSMDYVGEQIKNKTVSGLVIFFVCITIQFPFGFLWPLKLMRFLYNSLRN